MPCAPDRGGVCFRGMSTRFAACLALSIASLLLAACGSGGDPVVMHAAETSGFIVVRDPYAGIDWNAVRRTKANLHTHTRLSDGVERPEAVIDSYKAHGYEVLALTDHDNNGPGDRQDRERTTWPWTQWSRDPEALGMVAIEGNEISNRHHTGSLFCDYGDSKVGSEDVALSSIQAKGGLAVIYHPGCGRQLSVEEYAGLCRRHPNLVAMEVYNRNDRYKGDRATWDAVLARLAPARPVWAVANDDMHVLRTDLGFSWNLLLLDRLDAASVRQALESGRSFYVHAPRREKGPPVPEIQSVRVDAAAGTIAIVASGYDRIEWIANGAVVHEGATLELSALPADSRYVRAVVRTKDDGPLVGTQPFMLEPAAGR